MKVLIIGGGNGGLSFGMELMKKGIKVNLYDKFTQIIEPIIRNNNEITLVNKESEMTKRFNLVTTDLKQAVEGVQFIFVVTPAFAHYSVARDLVPYISDNQTVVLHPGRTGGALEVKRVFSRNGKEKVVVAEAETLLFACRKIEDTKIKIYGIKNSVGIATLPESQVSSVTNSLNEMLPFFHCCSSVYETSINNIGAIFHPTPFIFNLTRVECKEDFRYYHEGITQKIATLLEALDKERIEIGRHYGVKTRSALQWLNDNYHLNGTTLYESIQMNGSYRDIYAPLDVNSRYVLEDVPMGLVPLSYFAKKANLETPIIDFLITIASTMYNQNFYETGRTLESMGLDE